jgi:hypothetical protein
VAIGSVYYCKSLVTGQQSLVKIETAFDHEVRRRFCMFAPRGYKLSASVIQNSKSAFICADQRLITIFISESVVRACIPPRRRCHRSQARQGTTEILAPQQNVLSLHSEKGVSTRSRTCDR